MTEKKTILESVKESVKPIKMSEGDVEDAINRLIPALFNAVCEETEKRLAALEARLITSTQQETGDTATGWVVEKAWNPLNGCYFYDSFAKCGVSYANHHSHLLINRLIPLGNCFSTHEEAEDKGKWMFQDKLVLDQKLRVKGVLREAKSITWLDNQGSYVGMRCSKKDMALKILGTDAKRYLTGEK